MLLSGRLVRMKHKPWNKPEIIHVCLYFFNTNTESHPRYELYLALNIYIIYFQEFLLTIVLLQVTTGTFVLAASSTAFSVETPSLG